MSGIKHSLARWLRWLGAALLLLVFVVLIQLGNWQVQRLAWKRDLIARVDARIHAEPVAAPDRTLWPGIDRDAYEYLRVRLQGRFLHEHEALTQATTALGAGYWVLTPLQTEGGALVWINRGFVPPQTREPAQRGIASPEGEVSVTGLLRITEPDGGFLRDNAPDADRWHSRDVSALSVSRSLPVDHVAPYFVDQEAATNAAEGAWPVAGLTVVRFADNHLVYAVTWYCLALGLVVALWFAWRQTRCRV